MTVERYNLAKVKAELIGIAICLQYKVELYPYELSYLQWRRAELLTEWKSLLGKT